MPGRESHSAAARGRGGVDSVVDRGSVDGFAIAFRAVGLHIEGVRGRQVRCGQGQSGARIFQEFAPPAEFHDSFQIL